MVHRLRSADDETCLHYDEVSKFYPPEFSHHFKSLGSKLAEPKPLQQVSQVEASFLDVTRRNHGSALDSFNNSELIVRNFMGGNTVHPDTSQLQRNPLMQSTQLYDIEETVVITANNPLSRQPGQLSDQRTLFSRSDNLGERIEDTLTSPQARSMPEDVIRLSSSLASEQITD